MITYSDELYHHGIKGQKWGVRRYQNDDGSLTAAGQKRYNISEQKQKYKNAKRELSDLNKKAPRITFGLKSMERYRKSKADIEKAELNVVDEKAKLKSLKSKNPEKAEFNTYRKVMQRTGIRNSALDDASGGKSTKLYNHILETKGKAYADRVEKQVANKIIKQLVAYGIIATGSIALSAYIDKHYG